MSYQIQHQQMEELSPVHKFELRSFQLDGINIVALSCITSGMPSDVEYQNSLNVLV